jgi:hypothetical protein
MERPLLIVGIDPGTTVGYAFCDLTGRVVGQGSGRGLDIDRLVSAASESGRPVIVGCDKAKTPSLAASFAAKFGARVIAPTEDLRVTEKQSLTSGTPAANDHERDALAAAAFAFQRIERLLGRIGRAVRDAGKEALLARVQELVLRHGTSIAAAIALLERPEAPEARAVVQAIGDRQPRREDLILLHNELHELRSQNRMLRARLQALESQQAGLERRLAELRERSRPPRPERALRRHERRIEALALARLDAERERARAAESVERIRRLLVRSRGKTLLKRLATLGWDELQARERQLCLGPGDILLIEDPNSYSERALARLRELDITTLVTRKRPGRAVAAAGFTLVPADRLGLLEDRDVALVDTAELERERQPGILARVLDTYRKERQDTRA